MRDFRGAYIMAKILTMSRQRTSTILLTALLVSFLVAASTATAQSVLSSEESQVERKSLFRFLAIGDWGGKSVHPYCTDEQREVANGMALVASSSSGDVNDDKHTAPGAEFVLALGDNFYAAGLPMKDPEHATLRFTKTFEDVYSQEALNIPWYVLAGNHDYCGDVTKQLEYAQSDSTRWVFPDYNYVMKKNIKTGNGNGQSSVTLEIIMIDTQHIAGFFDCNRNDQDYPEDIQPHLQEKALSFIESKLENSSADYLLVAGHYPVFSACSNGNTQVLIDKLDPLMKKYGVTAYLSGHEHCQFHYNFENFDYLLTGNGNGCCYGSEEKKNLPEGGKLQYLLADDKDYSGSSGVNGGFASFDIGKEDMIVRMHIESGETLYETKLLPRKKKKKNVLEETTTKKSIRVAIA